MTILVAVSGDRPSDNPLAVGAELAAVLGSELVALHVMAQARYEAARAGRDDSRPRPHWTSVPAPTSEQPADRPARENPYPVDAAASDAARSARAVARETLGDDAAVRIEGRVGDPAEQIVREADRRDADYLVVGGRKRSPVGKAIFGSVTQAVLQQADRPVVTVPVEGLADARDGPVVAAVDRSARASRVVTEAERLASAMDRPLHVVHVAAETDPSSLRDAADPPSDDDLRDEAADVAAAAAEGVDDATAVGLVGAAGSALLEYATAEDATAVVAAGRKRSPVGKVLFGSVTQSVLLGADRPVLTVMVGD